MESVDIVYDNGTLLVRWEDGFCSPILVRDGQLTVEASDGQAD